MIGPARRRASTLQDALESYERALAEGGDAARLREVHAADLGPDRIAFLLATALPEVSAPAPTPEFAEAFANKLRRASYVAPQGATVLRPRFGARLAPLAMAACTIVFASLLASAFTALPGENLYALKGAAEDARVWFATGADEATVRVEIADERFAEVEALLERAELQALASSGTGVLAAFSVDAIDDPELARLIEATLADASFQLEKAAEILTTQPATTEDLDRLVDTSRRGQELATAYADDLPNVDQPPVVRTVVKFARIEAKAKAAKMKAGQEQAPATPGPCDTPTPSPEQTPDPTPTSSPEADAEQTGDSPELTPGVEETPESTDESATTVEADPSPTPEGTPCISPSPSPEPSPSPSPAPTTADAETEPAEQPDGSQGVDGSSDEQSTEMDDPHTSTSEA